MSPGSRPNQGNLPPNENNTPSTISAIPIPINTLPMSFMDGNSLPSNRPDCEPTRKVHGVGSEFALQFQGVFETPQVLVPRDFESAELLQVRCRPLRIQRSEEHTS